MRKVTLALSLLFQVFATFAILFIIYIIYALLDVDDADLINEIGFMIFQPLFGCFLSFITIVICFVVGLPVRFNSKLREWWLKRPLLPVAGVVLRLSLLLLSFNSNLEVTKQIILNGDTVKKEVPNTTASISGWFLTAFCLLHLYPQSLPLLFSRQRRSHSKLNPERYTQA